MTPAEVPPDIPAESIDEFLRGVGLHPDSIVRVEIDDSFLIVHGRDAFYADYRYQIPIRGGFNRRLRWGGR